MRIEFDSRKDAINLIKHGLSLALAYEIEWDTAIIWLDSRHDYGEVRYRAIAYIGLRLHFVVFVERLGNHRIISLRKANTREIKRYAKT